jgi:hypothetical protein
MHRYKGCKLVVVPPPSGLSALIKANEVSLIGTGAFIPLAEIIGIDLAKGWSANSNEEKWLSERSWAEDFNSQQGVVHFWAKKCCKKMYENHAKRKCKNRALFK